jgi:hypothetical protein
MESYFLALQIDGFGSPTEFEPRPSMRMTCRVVAPPSFVLISAAGKLEAQDALYLAERHPMGFAADGGQELRQRFIFAHENRLPREGDSKI